MANSSNAALGFIIIVLWIVGIVFGPLLIIWSLNTLFGLAIAYTWQTWLAASSSSKS